MTLLQDVPVILTRPPGLSLELGRRLEQLGARVVISPLIETRLVITPDLLTCVRQWSTFDACVVTSATALRAVAAAFTDIGQPIDRMDTPVFTVGEATQAAAVQLGLFATHPTGVGNAGELAQYLVRHWSDGSSRRVWWPCGQRAIATLCDNLLAAGHQVVTTVCYETVDVQAGEGVWQRYVSDPSTYICLHSPSAVSALVRQVGVDPAVIRWRAYLVCIGKTTRAACDHHGLSVAGVADDPKDQSLVEKILELARLS